MEFVPSSESVLQSLYPLFAPLPVSFVEHLVRRFERARRASPSTAWDLLIREVREKRDLAYLYMNPFIQNREVSTGWLLQTLTEHHPDKKAMPPQTLHSWHTRGLLRYESHGLPAPDSAAALFITRLIDPGDRNWLPTGMSDDEPGWWCWRQDTPGMPAVPCPVPLPANLPDSTLLWTPWAGAAWQSPWMLIGKERGAIRFVGTRKTRRSFRWDISYQALEQWVPTLASALASSPVTHASPLHDEDTEEVRQQLLHALATLALRHLALTRLPSSPE